MKLPVILSCIFLLTISACCTKEDCPIESYPVTFDRFSADEIDTIRIITEDMENVYPPDTIYTYASYYTGGGSRASLQSYIPFNARNRYIYYIPATGRSYRFDGYEFRHESCNSCFPKSAESKDHAIMTAYRIDGVRYEGSNVTITK